jgi:hypothetical protein
METAPLGELVVMVIDPFEEPETVGSKITLMEQLEPPARVPLLLPLGMQLLVTLNGDPVEVMELIATGLDVVLETVTLCGSLGLPIICGP